MASNQTEHYGLSQWELTDDVRMEDFNSDNAKIDMALKELQGAYTPDNKPYVVGGYAGDGTETRVIPLGFTPTAVLVLQNGTTAMHSSRLYGGLAVKGRDAGENGPTEWVTGDSALAVVEGGFQVSSVPDYIRTNDQGREYNYIAFR